MITPVLRTARLVLRPLAESDAAALHAVFIDAEVMRYWWRGPHESLAETEEAVARNVGQEPDMCWAITIDDGSALGWVNLRHKRANVAETGYLLSRACWGRGFGREALTAAIAYGFGQMGLRRIAADTDPDNFASIALLRSLGFVLEGHLRGEWETHIGVRHSLIFGMLADDWRGRSNPC